MYTLSLHDALPIWDVVKVHELARELGLTSKELIERLEAMKVPVRNHMSVLDDEVVERVRRGVAGLKESASHAGAPGGGPGIPGREAPRGPSTSVDAEKVKQSAFLQASYGSEIKGVRVIRATRAEAAPVVEAPPKAPAPAKPEKATAAPAVPTTKAGPKTVERGVKKPPEVRPEPKKVPSDGRPAQLHPAAGTPAPVA